MPVILQRGEALESQHKVSTKFGAGTLHVTDKALIIEIKKQGVVFHRLHSQMAGIEARGLRTIRIKWPEGSQLHEFDFKVWGAKEIVKKIKRKYDYEANYLQDGGSRVIFDEKQRDGIRSDRVKWAEKELKRAEKRLDKAAKELKDNKITSGEYEEVEKDTESWRDMAEHAKDVACIRSRRVPESVADHLTWHDAWTDGKYFYTFNVGWQPEDNPYVRARDSEVDGKTGAYRIPAEYVRFFHGYPYVKADAFETPGRYEMGWLIPSMTEEMLDTEMIVMAHRPRHRFENEIMIGEPGTPAILGYNTDLVQAKRYNYSVHESTLRWLAKHGRVPVESLRGLNIPDDFDRDAVGKAVAGLKY